MAIVTRTYQWEGPNLANVRSSIGPAASIQLGCVPFVNLTYDNAVADEKAADAVMAQSGFVPFVPAGASKMVSFVLFSPDTSGFDIEVSNLGVVTATKVPVTSAAPVPPFGAD